MTSLHRPFRVFAGWIAVTAISAAITIPQSANANTAIWIGTNNVSATTNWSDPLNWSNIGAGGTGPFQNDVRFNDATGVGDALTINNVVNDNENPFSVGYTNITTFQNTLIAPGQTLRISTAGLAMGGTFTNGAGTSPVATISGPGGTLVVSNGNVSVFEAFPATTGAATLNMSNLDTFVGTNVGRLLIGFNNGSSSFARVSGTLILAATNYINLTGTSPAIEIGDNSQNNGPPSICFLGNSNVIFVNSIGIGLRKQNTGGGGRLAFNPALTNNNPVLYLRGSNGVAPVATWAIADGQAQSGTVTDTGSCDFSGGTINALVNALWLGRNSTAGTAGNNATFTFSGGVLNVNNLTNAMLAANAGAATIAGTMNVNGTGLLIVNNTLVLAPINSFTGTANGTVNVNGGTLAANNVVAGGGNSTLTVTNGTLILTNTIGAVGAAVSTFTLANATLTLPAPASVVPVTVGTLNINGTSDIINISSAPGIGQFPLISFTTLNGTPDFTVGTLPTGLQGYISNNTSSIDLVITNTTIKTDTWRGNINGNWDIGTANWFSGGNSASYLQGDSVVFDDTLTGTTNVILTTSLSPASVSVNNSASNYVFSGTGLISGATGLLKSGNDTLTLSETGGDNFVGGITANGGTLVLDNPGNAISGGLNIGSSGTVQIGNNDANGNPPSGSLTDDGILNISRTDNLVIGTAISGPGSINQKGAGGLTLNANNTNFNGSVTASAGTLALTGFGSISNATTVTVGTGTGTPTFNISAVASTTLNSLALNFASLTLSDSNPSIIPLSISGALNMGGASNTINVTTLPPIASFPTALTLVQAQGGISGYNATLGTLPATFAGILTNNTGLNAIQLILTSGTTSQRSNVVWSGADLANGNTNWSDNANWQLPGAPTAADNVIFNDSGAMSGSVYAPAGGGAFGFNPVNVNNNVNANFSVSTLNYTNLGALYQNTYITNGTTLSVTNSMSVGSSSTDFGSSASEFVTFAGTNGTLSVNNTNSTFFVGLVFGGAGSEQATLDMSGLGAFNASVSSFAVGAVSSTTVGTIGTAYLAQTNTINAVGGITNNEGGQNEALSFMVGETGKNGAGICSLYLGQQNTIFANTIGVSLAKEQAQMVFNPIFVNPTASFYGPGGVGTPVFFWGIGDGLAQTGASTTPIGTVDFTGGTVNALVTTMYLGRTPNASGAVASTGTLTFNAGTIAVGTVFDGYQASSVSDFGVGNINVNGTGVFQVGTLNMAQTTGGAGVTSTTGALTINGGTVDAGTIVGGGSGLSTVTLVDNGTLVVSNTAGISGAALGTLSLTPTTTATHLKLPASATASAVVNTLQIDGQTSTTNILNISSVGPVTPPQELPVIQYTTLNNIGGNFNLGLGTLPAGYSGYLTNDTTLSAIAVVITSVAPTGPTTNANITSVSRVGTNMVIHGTNNNVPNTSFHFAVLASTNLLTPMSNWTVLGTNPFNGNGTFDYTNPIVPGTPRQFLRVEAVP